MEFIEQLCINYLIQNWQFGMLKYRDNHTFSRSVNSEVIHCAHASSVNAALGEAIVFQKDLRTLLLDKWNQAVEIRVQQLFC